MDNVPGTDALGSRAIVAGITRSAPYLARSTAMWSMPLSKGTMARTASGFLSAFNADSNLRSLYRDPQHICCRHFRGERNILGEIAESTFKNKLSGILRKRLAPHHHCHGGLSVSQTSTDQAANAASPKNRMSHGLRNCFGHRASILLDYGRRQTLRHLGVTERVVTRLGARIDTVNQIISGRNAAPLQPEQYIRLPAHGTDVDDLLQPEHMGRHTRINRVSQLDVIFS